LAVSGPNSYQTWCSGGQVLLVVLAVAWAVLESPAPVIDIRWRDGITASERSAAERQLFLDAGQSTAGVWHYELTRPAPANIIAIVRHPEIADTHQLDRTAMRVDSGATLSGPPVWWAGPFKGSDGPWQFRSAFTLVAALTLLCGWLARRQSAASGRRKAAPDSPRGARG
jgi:hypothetical protein